MRLHFLSFIVVFLVSCSKSASEPRSFKEIKKSGVLKVATIYGPTTYYLNKDEDPQGFEHDMVDSYAKSQNLKVEFIIQKSIKDVFDKVLSGSADLAAGGFSITPQRKDKVLFSSPYQRIQQQVVCKKGVAPRNIKQLSKYKTVVEKDSSYEERLKEISQLPKEQWDSVDRNTQALFQELGEESTNFDCTIADSHRVALQIRMMPELNIAFEVGGEDSLAWAFNKSSEDLKTNVSIWIESAQKQELLSKWLDKYYSKAADFDPYDLKVFMDRLTTRLPKYRKLFKKYASEFDFDWHLLAAISYQESHWDPNAISPTGVQGLMMLTNKTAKAMGVKNRKDPAESIQGGAKYLRKLIGDVSPFIKKEDKIWVALASYNVGAAHVRDARSVAVWDGSNPNQWVGIKKALPKLENKNTYWRLPYGYARGLEPVIYVRRIRHYLDLLSRHQ